MAKGNSRRRKRSTSRKSNHGGMMRWYLAAIILVAGVAAYDHRKQLGALPGGRELTALISQPEKKTKSANLAIRPKEHTGTVARQPALVPPAPVGRPMQQPPAQLASVQTGSNTFFFCGIRHDNCVIDGDTFLFNGERILIADIDAPETKLAKCDAERSRGSYAKARLRELLNGGEFTLVASAGGFADEEAGKPRVVMRGGKSLGDLLVSEGLVRKRASRPANWCGQAARASG
ncbi:thermonuclease family protein [Ensifer sp. BR816]|uniref:thermonuclease family protein n=1 Tax=Rhizobium sp. (strain BR816) TaxID=1057002 RepID=UPI00039A8D2A|nr:thermonuclease family protein [Ensifer sp. BR816]